MYVLSGVKLLYSFTRRKTYCKTTAKVGNFCSSFTLLFLCQKLEIWQAKINEISYMCIVRLRKICVLTLHIY